MKQNPPRRHHFVPRGYQLGFCGERELITVYDRVSGSTKPLHPNVVCCRNDFYAFSNPDGSANQEIERQYLARIDGMGITAIKRLSFGDTVSEEQVAELGYFIVLQFLRTPAQRQLLANADESRIASLIEISARQAAIAPEELTAKYAIDPSDIIEVNNSLKSGEIRFVSTNVTFLRTMITNARHFAGLLTCLNWVFLCAPEETGFITSDDPFVMTRPGDRGTEKPIGIATPGARKYFPLNRRVCLQIGDPGFSRNWQGIDSRDVRMINQSVASTANRFILGPEGTQLDAVISRAGIVPGRQFSRYRTLNFQTPAGIYEGFQLLQTPSFGSW